MNEITTKELNNPLYNGFFNEACEWAATWIETSANSNPSQEVKDFAANMAMSIRAGKLPVHFQIGFADAIRNDPEMSVEAKRFWLAQATIGGEVEKANQ